VQPIPARSQGSRKDCRSSSPPHRHNCQEQQTHWSLVGSVLVRVWLDTVQVTRKGRICMGTAVHAIRGGPPDIRAARRAGAIGNFIETFDSALYGIFAVIIAKLFFPTFDQVAGLISTFAVFGASFVVRPVGAMIFGHVGDRWGRKTVLISSILMMSIATAAVGVLPTYAAAGTLAPVLLLACRLLQGFSNGGEATTAFVLVAEHSPVLRRGRNIALLVSSTLAAIACVSLIALISNLAVSPDLLTAWMWRMPFLLAIPLGIVGLWLRLKVDDAEVYKAASEVSTVINKNLRPDSNHHMPIVQAFRKSKTEMLVLFLWAALGAVAGYITMTYMATQLIQFNKYTPVSAFGITAIALAIAAAATFYTGRIADRITRKQFAMGAAAGLALWSLPAFVLIGLGPVPAVIALAVFAILVFCTLISAGLAVVELFPVDVRASAGAIPYAVSFTVFGGTAPLIATWLTSKYSLIAPAFYVIAMAIVGFFVAWLGLPNAREMAIVSDDNAELRPLSDGETPTGDEVDRASGAAVRP
jgi:MFS transporter, MHS family, proline/betaine transporter